MARVIVGESGPTEAGIHSIMEGIGCGQEYLLRHIRNVRKPIRNTPDHFAVGSMLHAGKARWFSRGFGTDDKTWASIQIAMRAEMEREKLPVTRKALQMGERYMKEYITHWSKRPLPKPIACEYKLGPTPLEDGDPFTVWRTCRLDDVSHYPEGLNQLWLGETKTTSDSVSGLLKKYRLHPQILLQMVLWHMDPLGEAKYGPIKGVMLDVIVKSYDEKPSGFHREAIPIPPYAMEWFPRTIKAHLREIAAISHWDAEPVRNPLRCTRQEGRMLVECEYIELCLKGRAASGLYVMGKGEALVKHVPVAGKRRMPWE